MSPFLKTCISETLLLAALAVPVFGAGCERQSDPPVEPRSALSLIGTAEAAENEKRPVRGSDAAITARVKTALMADEQVKGLRIDVDTKDAEVTLKGALDTDEQVARAVTVARTVEGVRDVINRLSVKGEDKAAHSDKG
jgi:hyperosmotically inducible periplasmic protein